MEFPTTNEIKPSDFHSNIEFNLDGTDKKDLYDTMVERILEKIATFLAMKSDVRFHSVIKLELHTVSYKPLRGDTWIPLPKEPPSRTGGRIRRLPSCRVVKPHQWTRLFAVGGDS